MQGGPLYSALCVLRTFHEFHMYATLVSNPDYLNNVNTYISWLKWISFTGGDMTAEHSSSFRERKENDIGTIGFGAG